MTDETMSLRDLLEKTADTDFLREMIGFTARRWLRKGGPGRHHRDHQHDYVHEVQPPPLDPSG